MRVTVLNDIRRLAGSALLASALVWVAGSVVHAIERRPLPAFIVTTQGGVEVTSDTLTQDGKWLFVYVRPDCVACDVLLRSIDERQQPLVASRMVIVVGGTDDVAAFAARYPLLSTATWYSDSPGIAAKRLKAPGAPFVFGMKQQITEWALIGALADAESAGSALISWAGQP